MLDFLQNEIPLSNWVDSLVDWLTSNLSGLFSVLQVIGESVMGFTTNALLAIPPLLMMVILVIIAYFVFNRKWGLPILDRKSTRLNSSHVSISYAVFCFLCNSINDTLFLHDALPIC